MPRYFVTVSGTEYEIHLADSSDLVINGLRYVPQVCELSPNTYEIDLGKRRIRIVASGRDSSFTLLVNGNLLDVRVESVRDRLMRDLSGTSDAEEKTLEVRAPMPALVTAIEVAVGDTVTAGQGLLLLEAMKMENEIRAHRAGTVSEVCVEKGRPVEKGEILLRLR
jgi:pyruvate carboxylase subunit B